MTSTALRVVSVALPLILFLVAPAGTAGGRPNFVFILADDMGYSDAGCYGGEIETPNLDRLAAGGLRFSRCYNNAWCAPSRTSLLTGYYPAQAAKMSDGRGALKPSWIRVLPHYLKPYGYRSYHSGKWHLPVRQRRAVAGFTRSYSLFDTDRFFSPKRHSMDERNLPQPDRDEGYYATTAITDHAIDFLREHATAAGTNESPFFLYIAYTAPHFPLHAPKEDIAKYRDHYQAGWDVIRERRWKRLRKEGLVNCELATRTTRAPPPVVLHTPEAPEPLSILGKGETALAPPWKDLTDAQKEFQAAKMALHAAMVTRMDAEIGRVLDQLRAMGAMQDTVIFFASDNGACATIMVRGDGHDPKAAPGSADSYLGIGPGWASAANTPFRLHKVWTYEGGISTPLIVHWPAGIQQAGEIRHAPVHFIDIVPTLIELAGGNESDARRNNAGPPLPGQSIAPCFAGDIEFRREPIFLEQPTEWRSFWSKEDQLRYRDGAHGYRALITSRFKLVQPLGAPADTWELYDLTKDRSERNNLAARMPAKVRELSTNWNQSLQEFKREAAIP